MIRSASRPMPHATSQEHSELDQFRIKNNTTDMPCLLTAPKPSLRHNTEPNEVETERRVNIAPDDWDAMYQAIQKRLEDCVGDAFNKSLIRPLHERHATTKAAVLDCVAAMTQLHTSLRKDREARKSR